METKAKAIKFQIEFGVEVRVANGSQPLDAAVLLLKGLRWSLILWVELVGEMWRSLKSICKHRSSIARGLLRFQKSINLIGWWVSSTSRMEFTWKRHEIVWNRELLVMEVALEVSICRASVAICYFTRAPRPSCVSWVENVNGGSFIHGSCMIQDSALEKTRNVVMLESTDVASIFSNSRKLYEI
jgi:hypothetical protein